MNALKVTLVGFAVMLCVQLWGLESGRAQASSENTIEYDGSGSGSEPVTDNELESLIFKDGFEHPKDMAITSLIATPDSITEGEFTLIRWTTESTSYCTPSNGTGGWDAMDIHLPNGNTQLSIVSAGVYMFTLTCFGEGDNSVVENVSVTVYPTTTLDLVVINPGVSNTDLVPDQEYTINVSVRNQGNTTSTSSTLDYHLSYDDVVSTDDPIIGSDPIPGLSPGTDSAQNLVSSAPGDNGTYWAGACVNPIPGETNTGNQCSTAVQITVTTWQDSDGDRLADSVETNTGIYIDSNNTGTDPDIADTDGDGIKDGDEVLGTPGGLDLPGMGVNPLRKDLLLEYDWFNDSLGCATHTHRPGATTIALASAAFANSPVTNPGGVNGVNLINDYGQGGVFTGGNLINDSNGVIDGGIFGAEYRDHKAANFDSNRRGYFRYVLLPHRYNTDSNSSGQAEVRGDDLIVSLQCSNSSRIIANTILHEVGHNLGLWHGGGNNCNYKPNYNSVMNYVYQFAGIDNNCTPPGDGVLDFSIGDRIDLNENNLDENNGTCGLGFPWNWDEIATIESSVSVDINDYDDQVSHCGSELSTLRDYNDWANLHFGGLRFAVGARFAQPEIITERPVPAEYTNEND